jgi:hypothetical protein
MAANPGDETIEFRDEIEADNDQAEVEAVSQAAN